ncbi:MAG: UDP-N-acetylmuramoyl-L-alanyl-D-glutamate--2,6-diaminopimelate ligase [Spirochaetes bacterium]|nr:UDP-N-acetylmuramoyl-L-alanyl-D-glutamate--2,6-diaminopimelate ligase [Spirochaetota bacterium]
MMAAELVKGNMTLENLLDGTGTTMDVVAGDRNISVSSVEYDSRKVMAGSLFVAVEGFSQDGHRYVGAALDQGASAVVVSRARSAEFSALASKGVALMETDDTRRALSALSASWFGNPSRKMAVVGITGTNGKTSTTYMLESIAKAAGYEPGVIGTVDYRWKGSRIPAPNTTPESRDLQEIIWRMGNDGVNFLVMEVSSHGLELRRADDIDFDVAVFTNLTRDHLDFHHDFNHYFSAKKRLFEIVNRCRKMNRAGVVNLDDPYGATLFGDRAAYGYPLLGYGEADGAAFRVRSGSIVNSINGISYRVDAPGGSAEVKLGVGGRFNVFNSLAAFTAARALDIPVDAVTGGLSSMTTVPGRFDTVSSTLGFHVVVDYAHTDDALSKLLVSARELNPTRIITVFGCGGNRDTTKRPLMGKTAVELSDHVIVTSDNPRKESPDDIIAGILTGIKTSNYEVNPDRKSAIGRAIGMAGKGDIVVIAGKGHEDYQIIGETKHHFDDREIAREFIAAREGR